MPNESLETCLYYICEKALGRAKNICMGMSIKKPKIREKHLHSNKFMRTQHRRTDVMPEFFNIKTDKGAGSQ